MDHFSSKWEAFFVKNLLRWNEISNFRSMPWKFEKDPYKIWLSEIMLQQTRVEQGLDYYLKFLKAYPTIKDLAKSPENKLFKMWEGLGYYSRCKNLHATAKKISAERDGIFPQTHAEILSLKGVGPYTAAAIASFAFDLPYAVVDGNVMRVLTRFFGIEIPIDTIEGKKQITNLAQQLLPKNQSASFNQAIMDFGATICKPKNPTCTACVMQKNCIAYNQNLVEALPLKSKKIIKKQRWFFYIIAKYRNCFYIRMRSEKDIWQQLHEFILIEKSSENDPSSIIHTDEWNSVIDVPFECLNISNPITQQLTHQTIIGRFISIDLKSPLQNKEYKRVTKKQLQQLAFPKIISSHLSILTNL